MLNQIALNALHLVRRYRCPCDPERAEAAIGQHLGIFLVVMKALADSAMSDAHDAARVTLVPNDIDADRVDHGRPRQCERQPSVSSLGPSQVDHGLSSLLRLIVPSRTLVTSVRAGE